MSVNVGMYDYLMHNFEEKKDACAMSFLHRNFSYAFMADEIQRVAAFLKKLGIKKGDCVTLALPNIPSAVTAFYAVNLLGGVANMVHPLVPYEVLKEYMTKANSKLLFAFDILLDGYFDKLEKDGFDVVVCRANDYLNGFESFFYSVFGKKKCRNIGRCHTFKSAQKTKPEALSCVSQGKDTAVIMHSSGTTEKSKSVCLSNEQLNNIAEKTIEILPWKKKPGIGLASLTVLPLFHAFGLGVCIHTVLSYGYESVMIPKYNTKLIVKKMRRKNVAVIAGVPTMFAGIVNQKGFDGKHLKKLKFAFCGGDALNEKIKKRFDETVEKNGGSCLLDEGYGLTETAGVFSVNTRENNKQGSVGKPLGDGCAIVTDENGNVLPPYTVGEICLSTISVMQGYLTERGQDKNTLFEKDGKTFVKTGDLGYLDEEGFIFFKQRLKRVEKVSGVNVFPTEAEKVLSELEGVKACFVKGVDDERKGKVLKAFVLKEDGFNERELEEKLRKTATEKLDKWTQPKYYQFIEKVPVNKFGKTDYSKLR